VLGSGHVSCFSPSAMPKALTSPIALLLLVACGEPDQTAPQGVAGGGTGGAGIGDAGIGAAEGGVGGGDSGGTANGGAAGSTGLGGVAGAAMGGAGGVSAGAAGGAGADNGGAAGDQGVEDCLSLGCPAGEYCAVTELYVCPGGFTIEYNGRCVPFGIDCQGASSCDCVNDTCTPARCTEQDGQVQVVCWQGCWG